MSRGRCTETPRSVVRRARRSRMTSTGSSSGRDDAPQERRRAVRRDRADTRSPDRGEDPLLRRSLRADHPRDVRMDPLEQPAIDRPVPRRLRGTEGQRRPLVQERVVRRRERFEWSEIHVPNEVIEIGCSEHAGLLGSIFSRQPERIAPRTAVGRDRAQRPQERVALYWARRVLAWAAASARAARRRRRSRIVASARAVSTRISRCGPRSGPTAVRLVGRVDQAVVRDLEPRIVGVRRARAARARRRPGGSGRTRSPTPTPTAPRRSTRY